MNHLASRENGVKRQTWTHGERSFSLVVWTDGSWKYTWHDGQNLGGGSGSGEFESVGQSGGGPWGLDRWREWVNQG